MKTILDLCGGTGAWSEPYRKAGYFVYMFDLESSHEYNDYYKQDVRLLELPEYPVRGILAAPPCTEFSFAKHFHGKGNYHHDFAEGLSIVDACLRIITMLEPDWWALENPKNYLRRWLGEPAMTFDPWQYGDPYQKKTDLWGKFSIPKKTVTEKPEGIVKFSMLKSKEIYPEHYGKLTRTQRRAITPPGFAKAFFEANP